MAEIEFTVSVPDPTIWDTDEAIWGEADAIYAESRPVMIVGNSFHQVDNGITFAGQAVRTSLVRTGLTLFARDRQGNPKNDPDMIKEILGMWPAIKGLVGTEIMIYAGGQMTPEDPVFWEGPQRFVIGTDSFIDFSVSGRYLATRFESTAAGVWQLSGYDLDIEPVGER